MKPLGHRRHRAARCLRPRRQAAFIELDELDVASVVVRRLPEAVR